MAIFRRESSSAGSTAGSAQAPAIPAGTAGDPAAGRRAAGGATVIAAGTHLKGSVTGSTELHILGVLEGAVDVDAQVTIGAGGEVAGPVSGRVVRVVGRVTGNVTAGEIVEVGPAGSLEGDIAAPRVVIAEGAFFRGKVEMKSRDGAASSRPATPAAAGGRNEPKNRSGAEAPRSGAAEAGS